VLELLVVNAVALWVCVVLASDRNLNAKTEAALLMLLALAGHAGLGPSQLRCVRVVLRTRRAMWT
jgi:hypothetical protein